MDIISNLPDEIICHIGSFLSAKEAAFMALLSKQWRNLYEKVFQLTLDIFSDSCWFSVPKTIKEFPNLKTLIIEGNLHCGDGKNGLVCRCVSEYYFLLSCPVEVLKIKLYKGSIKELAQMKHFLEKLQCLELVEVHAQVSADKKLQVIHDLLLLPRASSKCRIKVKFFPKRY